MIVSLAAAGSQLDFQYCRHGHWFLVRHNSRHQPHHGCHSHLSDEQIHCQAIFPVYFLCYCHMIDMMSHKPVLKFSSVSNIISLQVRWTGEFYNSFRFLIPFFRIHLWVETSIFPMKRKIVADYPKYSETSKSSNSEEVSHNLMNSKQIKFKLGMDQN